MKRLLATVLLLFAVFGLVGGAQAAQFAGGDTYSLSNQINDDLFVGAQKLTISAPILGELFAAGNSVDVAKRPGRSVYAAGQTITVSDGAGYNVFAAGNQVTIKGTIDHDVFVAGNSVVIDPSAIIKGSVWAAGNQVSLNGKIDGSVNVSGTSVSSSAVIGGSVTAESPGLSFTGGSIGGDLTYKASQDAQGLSKVTIAGKTVKAEPTAKSATVNSKRKALLYSILSMIVMGAAFVLLVPHKITAIHDMLTKSWSSSLLTGLLTLVVTPIVAIILMVTTIGLPLGLIMLVLWFIALYMATITAQIIVGKLLLDRLNVKQQNWWLALVVGIVLTQLLFMIPVIGGILGAVFFIAVVLPTLGAAFEWWKTRLAPRSA